MTGIGILLIFLGYATATWGVNSIQGNKQAPFVSQIFPFAPKAA